MPVGSIDGTHGWGKALWSQLADGGSWAVPRCGLIYRKDEEAKRFALIARMPWQEGMPYDAGQLRADQDWDHERIGIMFAMIDIEVTDDTLP